MLFSNPHISLQNCCGEFFVTKVIFANVSSLFLRFLCSDIISYCQASTFYFTDSFKVSSIHCSLLFSLITFAALLLPPPSVWHPAKKLKTLSGMCDCTLSYLQTDHLTP